MNAKKMFQEQSDDNCNTLPSSLHADLQALALEEQTDLVEMLSQWVKLARHRRAWMRG